MFRGSVMSDSLRPHGLQHARLPCPSPSPRVCWNSCPLSWWCHPVISSSVAPFSSCPQSSPASGSFQWVGSLNQMAKVLENQLQHKSFQWIFRVDFLWDWLFWSLCCSREPQESSPVPQFKSISSSMVHLFLMVHLPHPCMTTGKTIGLTIWTFVGQVMSLLSHTLSRYEKAFCH